MSDVKPVLGDRDQALWEAISDGDVDAPEDPRAVLDAVRVGRFEPINRGPSRPGRLFKAFGIGTGVPPIWQRRYLERLR